MTRQNTSFRECFKHCKIFLIFRCVVHVLGYWHFSGTHKIVVGTLMGFYLPLVIQFRCGFFCLSERIVYSRVHLVKWFTTRNFVEHFSLQQHEILRIERAICVCFLNYFHFLSWTRWLVGQQIAGVTSTMYRHRTMFCLADCYLFK